MKQVSGVDKEFEASQELLKATMNSSLDMIQVFEAVRNEQGYIVDFKWILNNYASEKIYGDVIGKSLLTLNPGVIEEGIFDTLKSVTETGIPDQSERHYVHEQFNGWFYQSTVKLGDGVATTTIDITRLKQAEQNLKEKNDLLQSVLNNTASSIMVLKPVCNPEDNSVQDFEYVYTNDQTLKSVNRDSLTGKRLAEEFPEVKNSSLFNAYVKVFETGISYQGEINIAAYGFPVWAQVYARKVDNGVLVTYFDITGQKNAELQIKEQAHFIQTVTNTAPAIISITTHPGGETIFNNRDTFTLLGFDADELVRMRREDRLKLVHPEDIQKFRTFYARFESLGDQEEAGIEYRLQNKQGNWLWLDTRAKVFKRNTEGKATQILYIAQNITERKRAEQEIIGLKEEIAKKATDKYLTLFNNMVQAFCIVEVLFDEGGNAVDYRFLEVNPLFEKQTGLHNVTGRTMRELEPAHEEHWFRVYGEIAKTGKSVHFESKAAHLGSGIWYEVFALPFDTPENNQVAIFFYDITERKNAEIALKESEAQLSAFLESVPVAIAMINRDGKLVLSNKEMKHFLPGGIIPSGDENNQWRWQTWNQGGNPVEPYNFPSARALRGESVVPGMEFLYTNDDGRKIWTRISSVPVRDEEGQVRGVLTAIADISEIREASEALRLAEEKFRTQLEAEIELRTAELKESKELVEEITRNTPDLITIHDESNHIIYANHGMLWDEKHVDNKVFGLDDNKRALLLIHPDDIPKANEFLERRKNLADGEIAEVELRTEPAGTNWKWIRVHSKVFRRDGSGKATQIISFTVNITAEKEAELQIREQLHFIEQVTMTISDMLSVHSLNNSRDIIYSNRHPFEINGFDYEQIQAMSLEERRNIIHPEDRQAVNRYFENFKNIPDDGMQMLEYRARDVNGKWLWFHVRGKVFRRDENGQATECVSIVQNIDYLKRSEEALREAFEKQKSHQELLKEAEKIGHMGSWEKNLETGELIWSDELYRIYGLEPRSVPVSSDFYINRFVHPVDREKAMHQVWNIYENYDEDPLEYRIITSEGEKVVLSQPQISYDKKGSVKVIRGIVRDITLQKKTEQALIEAEKLVLIGKMTRTIAHEVRNPLSTVTMAASIVHDEAIKMHNEVLSSYTEMAIRNAKRIDKLIIDMLHTQKPESALGIYPVNDLLEEALVMEADRLRLAEIRVEKEFNCESRLELDKDSVLIAFLSIISNAIEAMEPGKGILKVNTKQAGNECIITIRDNGRGIKKEYLGKIFEPFFSRKTYGMGLGLANTLDIIKRNKGTIQVDSTEGKGTVFIVHFPMKKA